MKTQSLGCRALHATPMDARAAWEPADAFLRRFARGRGGRRSRHVQNLGHVGEDFSWSRKLVEVTFAVLLRYQACEQLAARRDLATCLLASRDTANGGAELGFIVPENRARPRRPQKTVRRPARGFLGL